MLVIVYGTVVAPVGGACAIALLLLILIPKIPAVVIRRFNVRFFLAAAEDVLEEFALVFDSNADRLAVPAVTSTTI